MRWFCKMFIWHTFICCTHCFRHKLNFHMNLLSNLKFHCKFGQLKYCINFVYLKYSTCAAFSLCYVDESNSINAWNDLNKKAQINHHLTNSVVPVQIKVYKSSKKHIFKWKTLRKKKLHDNYYHIRFDLSYSWIVLYSEFYHRFQAQLNLKVSHCGINKSEFFFDAANEIYVDKARVGRFRWRNKKKSRDEIEEDRKNEDAKKKTKRKKDESKRRGKKAKQSV